MDDSRGLVVSQGARPLTISIRVGGSRERVQSTLSSSSSVSGHRTQQTPSYRQLPSSIIRTNYSRGMNSFITKLKTKRTQLFNEASNLQDELTSIFPVNPDPVRKKCHYDYMLEEMRLMANDFVEERRWKVNVAYILAHEAKAFYHRYLYPRIQAREKEQAERDANSLSSTPMLSSSLSNSTSDSNSQDELEENRLTERHKQICHLLSGMVQDFWSKVHAVNDELNKPLGEKKTSASTALSERDRMNERTDCRVQITLKEELLRDEYLQRNKMELEQDQDQGQEEKTVEELYAKALQEGTMEGYIRRCGYYHLPMGIEANEKAVQSNEEETVSVEVEKAFYLLCQQMSCCSHGRGMVVCEER